MEPQTNSCCNRKNDKCCCLYRILYVILGLFAFILGIIIGALTTIVTTVGTAYFYATATILLILAVITLIYVWCNCRN